MLIVESVTTKEILSIIGYTKSINLNEHDWDAIIPGIGARLAVSLVMGAYSNQVGQCCMVTSPCIGCY